MSSNKMWEVDPETRSKLQEISKRLGIQPSRSKSPAYSLQTNRWTAFDSVEKATEHAAYAALMTVSRQIIAEVESALGDKCPKRLFDFVNEGDGTPLSVEQGSTSKPVCFFLLCKGNRQTEGKTGIKKRETAHWLDIGPTAQYKADNSERATRDVSGFAAVPLYSQLTSV